MNIFDLLESPGMGRPRDTKGIQSADDQSAASVIGSGTTKRESKKKPVTMMGMNVKESSAHDNFKKSVKDRGYDMDAGAKRLEDLLAKQKREREERERAEQGNEVKEAHPNQQMSIYNPDGPTYRQEKMPGYDVDDIYSRGQAVDLDPEVGDINAPEDHLDAAEKANLKKILKQYMDKLSPVERNVIFLRFWEDHTLESAGKILGVTPERVRQIEARAMRKIRQFDKESSKDLLGLSKTKTYEGILDRATPKMPKPRNPANAVLGNKVNAAGKHLDKKRRQDLNPKHKHKDPLAESLRPGEHLTWTVHFADGTSQQVNVPSDEFDVRAYFAKRDKQVVKVDRNYAIQGQQQDQARPDNYDDRADRATKAHIQHDRGLTEQELEEEFRLGKKLGTRRDRFKSLRKRKDGILSEVEQSQVTKITDYDLWLDEVKALGAEIYPQKDRNVYVAQSWDGDVIGKFHLGKGYGFINQQSVDEVSIGDRKWPLPKGDHDDEMPGDDNDDEMGIDETIRKINNQYRLLSKKGKNLGTFDTKAGAEKHEREVQYFKHKGMSEATGDNKFDSMMGKIGSDPWTKIFSNPNFDENIEAFCERPLSKFEQKMSQMDIEVSEDGDTINPLWLKYYIPFSTKMAQKFISQHKLNPNDPDLVMKVRHFIDWQANEGEPAGLLSGNKLPLDTVKVDDPRWDDAMDQMRPGMDKIFPDGNKRKPDPRKLDPGMMEDMDEGWKGKLAGAALAGAAALGGGDVDAQNINLPGPQVSYVAHVSAEANGREVHRTVNLGSQYSSEDEAYDDIERSLQAKGITRYNIRIEQKYDAQYYPGSNQPRGGTATGREYATPGIGDMVIKHVGREIRAGIPSKGGYATGGTNRGERPRDGSQWWRDQLPQMREDTLAEDIESHLYLMSRAGYDIVQEEWSDKYKDSINCSNPKGFSQKAHCAGKKKNEDVSEEKVRLDPKCWKGKKIGNPKTKMKGGVRVNNCVPK